MAKISDKNIAYAIYLLLKNSTLNEKKFFEEIKNIVRYLSRKRLLGKISGILLNLRKIIDEENNAITVKVLSANKLSLEDKKNIIDFLQKKYLVSYVQLEEKIDQKIIGGVRLEINDEIIDLSLKNKIRQLKKALVT